MTGMATILAVLALGGTPEVPDGASARRQAAAPAPPAEPARRAPRPISSAVDLGGKWGVVTSVRRSPERNRAVGGAENSFHLFGRAIDIARRPGVRHAEIDAAYRKAGYVLIESLDEGDHSHFAFGIIGGAPSKAAPAEATALAAADPKCPPASDPGLVARRRPDRTDGCAFADEPKPRLRPLEAAP
jgi:hypothetical protein